MQNGITLIALVVTIVVLLILAGVSINLVVGNNGIVTKAGDARDKTEQAKANEEADLLGLEDDIEKSLGTYDPLKRLPSKTIDEAKSGLMTENTKVTFPDGTVIVPEGYKIATDSASTIAYGVVITDALTNGNEWVWVPVADPSVMYETASTPITLTGGTKDGAGILDLKINNNPVTVSKYTKPITITNNDNTTTTITRVLPNDTSSYREVDVVVGDDGTSYDAVDTNRATAGFTKTVGETTTTMTLAEMADMMRSEYETMIASIEKYHGFYIGRYELTANGEKTGATLTRKTWYYLYNQCKGLSASNKVMSRMIWGCQWDVTCNWIANYGDKKNISDSSTWGNYYGTSVKASDGTTEIKKSDKQQILDTGITTFTRANNIYDFAGNCSEWTQEASSTYYRASRGGNYYGSGSYGPASNGSCDPTVDHGSNLRFSSHFNSATLSN